MKNLSHSASFESLDKNAPSKYGTKQLVRQPPATRARLALSRPRQFASQALRFPRDLRTSPANDDELGPIEAFRLHPSAALAGQTGPVEPLGDDRFKPVLTAA